MARCGRISRLLTAYADDELSAGVRERVEKHLARCESCARELDSIRRFDTILAGVRVPPVSDNRWSGFKRELSGALDGVDREGARRTRVREAQPVFGGYRRRALATAGALAAVVVIAFVVAGGPGLGLFSGPNGGVVATGGSNECTVESIETHAAGYTPMFFTSRDAEMTVIWVFSESVEGGPNGNGPGAL